MEYIYIIYRYIVNCKAAWECSYISYYFDASL